MVLMARSVVPRLVFLERPSDDVGRSHTLCAGVLLDATLDLLVDSQDPEVQSLFDRHDLTFLLEVQNTEFKAIRQTPTRVPE
jgi:hypothetical protein